MNDDKSKDYREAFEAATTRARWVLLALVSASIIAFAAAWNSAPFGWVQHRIEFFQYALDSCAWDKDAPAPPGEAERFSRTQRFLERSKLMDKDRIEDRIKALEQQRLEHVLFVHVPFFGIAFDVNDLGFLTGLTFAVLLLMFRYSLVSELRALRAALAVAPDSRELLTLCQVLTVPEPTSRLWRNLPKASFFMPVLVQSFVLKNDLLTLDVGLALTYWWTCATVGVDMIFLFANLWLSIRCIGLSREMDHEWRK